MSVSKVIISIIDKLYVPPFSKVVSHELFAYALCGVSNMVLDIIWYYFIYHHVVALRDIDLGIVVVSPHIASLIIVFPITFFTGFWLNRNVAFRVTEVEQKSQLIRYALSVAGSLLLNYVCMKFFVEYLNIWATPSKMLTTSVCVVYSFIAAKFFTFTKSFK